MVGQLLEIRKRSETAIEYRSFMGKTETRQTKQNNAFFFLQAAAWVYPGGAPFSQLDIGVTDAMAIIKS